MGKIGVEIIPRSIFHPQLNTMLYSKGMFCEECNRKLLKMVLDQETKEE